MCSLCFLCFCFFFVFFLSLLAFLWNDSVGVPAKQKQKSVSVALTLSLSLSLKTNLFNVSASPLLILRCLTLSLPAAMNQNSGHLTAPLPPRKDTREAGKIARSIVKMTVTPRVSRLSLCQCRCRIIPGTLLVRVTCVPARFQLRLHAAVLERQSPSPSAGFVNLSAVWNPTSRQKCKDVMQRCRGGGGGDGNIPNKSK